jgi:GTPase SAR1 family protein
MDAHSEIKPLLDEFVTSILHNKPKDLIKYSYEYFSRVYRVHSGPLPVVICGPSGVGKGTLIQRLIRDFPETFGFSVSHTTRAPRPGEVNGVHYYFVSVPEFEEAVSRGDFVEHAKVHTNFYGTSFQSVDRVSEKYLFIFFLRFLFVFSLQTFYRLNPKIKFASSILISRDSNKYETPNWNVNPFSLPLRL